MLAILIFSEGFVQVGIIIIEYRLATVIPTVSTIHKKELQQNSLSVGHDIVHYYFQLWLGRTAGRYFVSCLSLLTLFSQSGLTLHGLCLATITLGQKKLSLPFYLLIAKLSNIVQTENFETYLPYSCKQKHVSISDTPFY